MVHLWKNFEPSRHWQRDVGAIGIVYYIGARRPQYARASFAAVKNDADMAQAAARMAALYRAYTKNIKGEEEICASW